MAGTASDSERSSVEVRFDSQPGLTGSGFVAPLRGADGALVCTAVQVRSRGLRCCPLELVLVVEVLVFPAFGQSQRKVASARDQLLSPLIDEIHNLAL